VEIRTGWFDRSKVYKLDDPLTVGSTPGELTLYTGAGATQIVGRVSALPRFEGGNPQIGNVNYNYVSGLPAVPAAPAITDKVAFNTAVNAWIIANAITNSDGSAITPFLVDRGVANANDAAVAASYLLAVTYRNANAAIRQAASDVSSLQALDNSVITFVTARI
jgi:hypothetical protein